MQRLFFLLAFAAFGAQAAPPHETWISVLLGGRKIGNMQTVREEHGDRVVTTQRMQIEFDRAGTKVALTTVETDEETRAGVPLAFESRTLMSGSENVVRGTVRDGQVIDVKARIGGANQSRSMAWPAGALLAEGLRLAEQRAGTHTGAAFTSLAFQPENLEAIAIDSSIGETAKIELPEGARELTRIEQTIRLPDAPAKSTAWVDADQTVQKLLMPVMGYELTMLACSRECAQAPNQTADILVHSLVHAPRPLSAAERREPNEP